MDFDNGAINHGIFHIRFLTQGIENTMKNIALDPFAKALVARVRVDGTATAAQDVVDVRIVEAAQSCRGGVCVCRYMYYTYVTALPMVPTCTYMYIRGAVFCAVDS